jgi:putative hydrolase of the HAD superfamily
MKLMKKLTTSKFTHPASLPPLSEGDGGGSSSKPLLRRGWGRLYDHLFFDLDNTLWDFSTNSKLALEITLDKLGLLTKIESFEAFYNVYEPINESLWEQYRTKAISKQKLISDRFSQSLGIFGINNLDWEDINNEYLTQMALQTKVFPETIETLVHLRSKGYQMHIITNGFYEVQHHKLINCGLREYFGRVFISEELKTTKPHREIFEHALKSTNARKSKSIMIGDSWETDIEGAMNFGIDQVMFLNNGVNKIPDSIKSNHFAINSPVFLSKPKIKTYFIEEIAGLRLIL